MFNSSNRSRNLAVLALCLFLALVGAMALVFRNPAGPAGATPGSPLAAAVLQAREALRGSPAAFDALARTSAALDSDAGAGTETGDQVRTAVTTLLKGRQDILAAWEAVAEVEQLAAVARRAADEVLLTAGAQPGVSAGLQRFDAELRSVVPTVRALVTGPGRPTDLANALGESEVEIAQVLGDLRDGNAALGLKPVAGTRGVEALARLVAARDRVFARVRDARVLADRLDVVAQAARQLDAVALRASAVRPATVAKTAGPGGLPREMLVMALLVLSTVILIVMVWAWFRSAPAVAAAPAGEHTDRNQQAILRLLDELSSLADGDLTVQATVTEDITGAIADSINYAVEALRELVTTINQSAILLDGAAKSAESTAVQLAQASEAQSKQVDSVSQAISRMVNSIEEVSGDAERSSDVARHSVDVAHKGGEAVRRTIAGMNAIRETIQDTSKRIKRLGESSQEIGNIVELINDIADQTNILALNASIQASMAGEAGRGFAVVADEVQRLAERSANATKQIEVLVRTIQADTNEAIVSMERSTADVVGGALLAENAGAALEEIEQVSSQIASLVQNISGSAREQAGAAAAVIRIVELLQQINAQNATGTGATKDSISKLAALAAQLRRSVAGFRLPSGAVDARAPRSGGRARTAAPESPGPEERTLRIVDKKTA